ncbi:hypothetical protein GQ607_006903 [Colletotrichum asianum]|uniref:Uncharacterized protein n=1 Tax=Colletotrichum asianum TaxID=702518 RepID=A0A8H3WBD1_9PEZI|nr:hypothetical protein GQ607_006903 [Colletotrichum asianum]
MKDKSQLVLSAVGDGGCYVVIRGGDAQTLSSWNVEHKELDLPSTPCSHVVLAIDWAGNMGLVTFGTPTPVHANNKPSSLFCQVMPDMFRQSMIPWVCPDG